MVLVLTECWTVGDLGCSSSALIFDLRFGVRVGFGFVKFTVTDWCKIFVDGKEWEF